MILVDLQLPGCIILEPLWEERLERYRDSGWTELRVSFGDGLLELSIQNSVTISAQMQALISERLAMGPA